MKESLRLEDVQDVTFKRVYAQRFCSGSIENREYTESDLYWEDHFCNVINKGKIHGSADRCFENAAYKIRNLFIQTKRTKETEQKLLSLVDRALVDPGIVEYKLNGLNMIVAHLLIKGYTRHQSVVEFAQKRIDTVFNGIMNYGHDIYMKAGEAKGVPKAFRGRKVVVPNLIQSQIVSLPQIHDILYFHVIGKHYPNYLPKIDRILRYILTKEYQSFPQGYGIGLYGERYYSIGWSITIPSFTDHNLSPSTVFNLLHLSNYTAATRSDWFRNMLDKLEEYKTGEDCYELLKDCIREKKNVYFVGGGHLGVVANRRLKHRGVIESTYWCNCIKQNAQNAIDLTRM